MQAATIALLWLWWTGVSVGSLYHEGSRALLAPSPVSSANYFGYSVLLQDTSPPRLVVGAPGSANEHIFPSPKIEYAGEVYACPLKLAPEASSITCEADINYYDEAASFGKQFYSPYMKYMGLGAAVTDVYGDSLVMCAPRWANEYKGPGGELLVRAVNGLCYVVSPGRRDETLIPLIDSERQTFKNEPYYEYGQAGFSAGVSADRSWLLLGAPGLARWTGGVVKYRVTEDGGKTNLSLQPTTNPDYTKELKQDSYFGYAVAAGIFDESGATLGVAGAPRGHETFGEVFVFGLGGNETDPLDLRANLTGSQLGEYFGSALLVVDLNGDGREDLLVGAPQHVSTTDKNCCYDQGAVYVYINKKTDDGFKLELQRTLKGAAGGARFGYALADLGDVDGDGYSDVAIGAPWEETGAGAVYIYRGSALGLQEPFAQRIFPNAPELKGFGFSIARAIDLDKNGCKDLAVGSVTGEYGRGSAAVFRCSPTLVVKGSIKLVNVPTTRIKAGVVGVPRNTTELTAQFCVRTLPTSRWPNAVRDVSGKISINFTISDFSLAAKSGEEKCQHRTIQVEPTVFEIPLSLEFNAVPDLNRDGIKFDPFYANLGTDSILSSSLKVYFLMDCGDDLVCTPDFKMNFSSLSGPRYIPGVDERLGVSVTITNDGENAYGACVKISLPSPPLRVPSDCKQTASVLTCNLARPYRRNAATNWTIELEKEEHLTERDLTFAASVYDACDENVSRHDELSVRVEPRVKLMFIGHALPNATLSVTRAVLAGPIPMKFAHKFIIFNQGPSDLPNAEIMLYLSPKVSLSEDVEGCARTSPGGLVVNCTRRVNAGSVRSPLLYLRFDVGDHETELRAADSLQVTTRMEIVYGNTSTSYEVSSWLSLEPGPAVWPIVLGVFLGLLLIALLIFILYKAGFFNRSKKQELEKLKEQSVADLSGSEPRPSTSVADLLDDGCTSVNTSEPMTPGRVPPPSFMEY